MHMDDYDEIYKLDMLDEWRNTAWDEDGNAALCEICESELRWSEADRMWHCPGCGRTLSRAEYFNFIGAQPPDSACLTNCLENYPFCKKYCERFCVDPNDPMLAE